MARRTAQMRCRWCGCTGGRPAAQASRPRQDAAAISGRSRAQRGAASGACDGPAAAALAPDRALPAPPPARRPPQQLATMTDSRMAVGVDAILSNSTMPLNKTKVRLVGDVLPAGARARAAPARTMRACGRQLLPKCPARLAAFLRLWMLLPAAAHAEWPQRLPAPCCADHLHAGPRVPRVSALLPCRAPPARLLRRCGCAALLRRDCACCCHCTSRRRSCGDLPSLTRRR